MRASSSDPGANGANRRPVRASTATNPRSSAAASCATLPASATATAARTVRPTARRERGARVR